MYNFELCRCSWTGDGGIRKCGCDDPDCVCRLYRSSTVIHWLGEHWNITCAMYQAAKILNQLENRIKNDIELGGVNKAT